MSNSNEQFVCPHCGTGYPLRWVSHAGKCFLNPTNLKLFAKWIERHVKSNSQLGVHAVTPYIKEWREFTNENRIISPAWTMNYLEEDDVFEAVYTILETAILSGAATLDDISPEVLYLYDSTLFQPYDQYAQNLEKLEQLENFLLNH